ncbi:polymer-forming cytoskeletal protein [Candidatus Puniceispirillum sp.]|nr:polymer-forming cytoskeletal protein [Candidatus Puniceispirillum sp.]
MFGINTPEPSTKIERSRISEDLRITGSISASKPVIMSGQLDGNIDAVSMHIASTGVINGDIKADNLKIDGTVIGNIVAEQLHLSASGCLKGEVRCRSVVIDEGANVEAKFIKELNVNG